jgi:hypothetical protein
VWGYKEKGKKKRKSKHADRKRGREDSHKEIICLAVSIISI